MPTPQNKFHGQGSGKLKLAIAIVIILILIYGIAYMYFIAPSGSGSQALSSKTQITLAKNQTQFFFISGVGNTYAIFAHSLSPSRSVFYLTKTPILANPITVISLSPDSAANLTLEPGQSSDMNIFLSSSTNSSAVLYITPIPVDLGIKQSNVAYSISTFLLPFNATQVSSTTQSQVTSTTTSSTTTISSSQISAATTSTPTTTIASAGASVSQSQIATVMSIMNLTQVGTLMSGYSSLYQKDTACTPAVYNSTYQTYFHVAPSGASSFHSTYPNTSQGFKTSVTAVGSGLFNVSYTIILPSGTQLQGAGKPVLIALVNVSSFNAQKFTYGGIWAGLNYSSVNAAYSSQSSFLNNCGAYMP